MLSGNPGGTSSCLGLTQGNREGAWTPSAMDKWPSPHSPACRLSLTGGRVQGQLEAVPVGVHQAKPSLPVVPQPMRALGSPAIQLDGRSPKASEFWASLKHGTRTILRNNSSHQKQASGLSQVILKSREASSLWQPLFTSILFKGSLHLSLRKDKDHH